MGVKTGKQYVESLRDGRRLCIDGQVVTDVTSYAPLQGVIETIASLYDDQHKPELRDILTYRSPCTGEMVSKTYLQAHTMADLQELAHLRPLRTSLLG